MTIIEIGTTMTTIMTIIETEMMMIMMMTIIETEMMMIMMMTIIETGTTMTTIMTIIETEMMMIMMMTIIGIGMMMTMMTDKWNSNPFSDRKRSAYLPMKAGLDPFGQHGHDSGRQRGDPRFPPCSLLLSSSWDTSLIAVPFRPDHRVVCQVVHLVL